MTREMLLEKSLDDLRQIAKALNIKSITKYRKAELADIIMSQEPPKEPAKKRAKKPEKEPGKEPVKEPEKEPAKEPAPLNAAQPAVDYAPRKRGRPRKAMNDPTPIPAEKAEAPLPAHEEQHETQEPQHMQPGRAEDRRYQPARRENYRQQERQSGPRQGYQQITGGRAQSRAQNDRAQYDRVQYDRGAFDRQERPQNERGQGARFAEEPPFSGEENVRAQGYYNAEYGTSNPAVPEMLEAGDCGDAEGILEIAGEGFGFLRCENYLPGPKDVYISNAQIRRFRLKTGDKVAGKTRPSRENDKYPALLYINKVNGLPPEEVIGRRPFEELVPIFPDSRFTLERRGAKETERMAIRLIDLMSPIGRGQRGLIVSQPKAGKTTLLKNIANGIAENYPEVKLIVLLIDERPEEVTDMQRSIKGEVVYSTFDELPERHARVSEMVLEHAMRLVEQGEDVVILMDSITRLARAYNLTITPTGRTLSGGMDPGALYKPKRFFGAARNIENGGSLTVIATALVETGSRMDDMVYEEFKGTGNMEIHLDRKLSERRIFPAIDIYKSGTRRDELLLSKEEAECANTLRRMLAVGNPTDVTEQVIDMLGKTETNEEFLSAVKRLATGYEGRGGYTAGKGFMR